jgi:hypothetical protein
MLTFCGSLTTQVASECQQAKLSATCVLTIECQFNTRISLQHAGMCALISGALALTTCSMRPRPAAPFSLQSATTQSQHCEEIAAK